MADDVTIEVSGLAELQTTLLNMPVKASKIAMREALIAAGTVFLDEIEATVPRRTGELAGDIVIMATVGSDLSKNFCEIGPAYIPGRTAHSADDPGVFVKFLEYGHRSKGGGKMIPPHPFMRPAFAAGAPRAIQAFAEVMRALLGSFVNVSGSTSAALVDGSKSANMGGTSSGPRRATRNSSSLQGQKKRWQEYVNADKATRGSWDSFRQR